MIGRYFRSFLLALVAVTVVTLWASTIVWAASDVLTLMGVPPIAVASSLVAPVLLYELCLILHSVGWPLKGRPAVVAGSLVAGWIGVLWVTAEAWVASTLLVALWT